MEILASALVPAVDGVSSHAGNRWRDHRDLKKNTLALKEASQKLTHRKQDLKKRLETEVVPEETEELEEVKFWLESVENIICEAEQTGIDVARVKFVSRARLSRRIREMIPRIERLYEEGGKLREVSLVMKIERRGREIPTTAVIGGESTSDKTKSEILRCLADKQVTRIGIHGMGGSGKTTLLEHIHNELLKTGDEIGSNFDKIIWVTASKATGIRGLQDKIGCQFELGALRDKDEEETRAIVLLSVLKNKSFLLIIDDLWEDYPLEKLGVPNPTPENGCKLVLTTRSRDVCSKMRCDEIIKMGFLSEEEATELFFDNVGKSVASDPKLNEIARRVAIECAGLPLAIVTIAGSLRDKSESIEWEVALTELKHATSSMSIEITSILRFSYDRLKYEHKACILHCALYSEDHLIPRDLLRDQLIALGSVEKGRASMFDKCHVMLNGLVRDCLLIDAVNKNQEKCVKLHDSVRDMAIQIMRETPSRFLVEDFGSLEGEKWDENLEKVSLRGKTETLSLDEPRECPRLSTLFLNVAGLKNIPDDFFARMKGLCVIDLSDTKIQSLPRSIVELENISVLSLKDCYKLKSVPDLSELKNLTRLDLQGVKMEYFPEGIDKLVKLAYLDLGDIRAQTYPKGFLSKLTELRYLSVVLPESAGVESAEELATLNKLETLKVEFWKFNLFRSYFKLARPVSDFRFGIGSVCYGMPGLKSVSLNCDLLWMLNLMAHLCAMDDDDSLQIAIPNNVEVLRLMKCDTSLCRLIFIKDMRNLQRLELREGEMEYMLYHSLDVIPLLLNITKLELSGLNNLRALICHEGDGAALPLGAFSALKKLTISECHALKTVFVVDKESSLPHLEELSIEHCEELEEIIAYEDEDAMKMELPALKILSLFMLPKLKSAEFVANSLSRGEIKGCPELKKVDYSLQPLIEELCLNDCNISVCRLISVEDLKNRHRLVISRGRMEYMILYSPAVFPLFSNITELELHKLSELCALMGHEGDGTASPAPLPLAAFFALKKLTITECHALKTVFIVDKESSLPHLEYLSIYRCDALKTVFIVDKESSLPHLEYLSIKRCEELEEIIRYEDEGDGTAALPLGAFSALKKLIIAGCDSLKRVFVVDKEASLPHLEELTIMNCEELEEIIRYEEEGDGTAPLPLAAFSALKYLTILDCDALKRVFVVDKESSLPHLEELSIIDCRRLEEIMRYEEEGDGTAPLPLAAFSALKYLTIEVCHSLKRVFTVDKESSLPHLEQLSIHNCGQLEEIIRYEDEDAMRMELPALKRIALFDLPKLKSAQFVANSLWRVRIRRCPELEKVASSSLRPFFRAD